MITTTAARQLTKPVRRHLPAGWFGAVATAILVFAGQVKEAPSLGWIPVDLTLLSAILVAVSVIVSRVRFGMISGRIAVPITVFVSFLFGVFSATLQGHSATKVALLFTITLLLALAPFYLLRTPGQRKAFLAALVGIGIFTAATTLLTGSVANEYSNRLSLEGSNTIATAQMVGAAAIIWFIAIFRGGITATHRVALFATVCALAFVALASGSRGPVIGAALALFAALMLIPGFRAYRGRAAAGFVLVGSASALWAVMSGTDGFTRIFGFVSGGGDASTDARQSLWAESWTIIQANPFGIGWGNFQSLGFTYPHNLMLEVAVEAGLTISVLLLIYVSTSAVRITKLCATTELAPFMALLVFSLFNAMVSSDINGNRLLWVMLSVAWVVGSGAQKGARDI